MRFIDNVYLVPALDRDQPHLLPEVTITCAKVLIINQGKIVAFDEIKQLANVHGKTEQSLEEIFIKLTAA